MSSLADVQRILDFRELTTTYRDWIRDQPIRNPLFDWFTTGVPNADRVYKTDEVEYIKLGQIDVPAPTNRRGNPARVMQPEGKSDRSVKMLNLNNRINFGFDHLQMLRHPEEHMLQEKGAEELNQQMEAFSYKNELARRVYVSKYLLNQTIYVGEDGHFYDSAPTPTGYSIATGIPSANLSQIALSSFGGSGNAIDTPWDNPAARILDQLLLIDEAAEYQGTQPIKHIWLNTANKKWLWNNDQILEQFALNKSVNQEMLIRQLQGDSFELNGYTFHFFGGRYTDGAGTNTFYIPKTKAILHPDMGPWVMSGKGLQLIPDQTWLYPDINGAIAALKEAEGDFSYARLNDDPTEVQVFAGFNWLWALKNPESIFSPTVDF